MLGRFASLAVADTVRMTSYYNNHICYYCMYKNIDTICIEKLYDEEAPCKNGFEVHVTVPYSESQVYEAIYKLKYFDKLYINDINVNSKKANAFNNRKIKNCGLYSLCNIENEYNSKTTIRYGNVIYQISNEFTKLLDTDIDLGDIAINFNIGELDINPNRESLLANQRTTDAFRKQINKVYQYLITKYVVIKGDCIKFDNIDSYRSTTYGGWFTVKQDCIGNMQYTFKLNIKACLRFLNGTNVSYYIGDVKIPRDFDTYFERQHRIGIKDAVVGNYSRGKFTNAEYYDFNNLSLYGLSWILNPKVLMQADNLSVYDRKYVRKTYPGYGNRKVFVNINKLNQIFADEATHYPQDIEYLTAIKHLIDEIDIEKLIVPSSFIENEKKEERLRRQHCKDLNIIDFKDRVFYRYDHMSSYNNMVYGERFSMEEVMKLKYTFIYGEKDDPLMVNMINDLHSGLFANTHKIKIILCAKKYLRLLEGVKNALNIMDFLYKPNGLLRSFASQYYSFVPSTIYVVHGVLKEIEGTDFQLRSVYRYGNDMDVLKSFIKNNECDLLYDNNIIVQQIKRFYPFPNDIHDYIHNMAIISLFCFQTCSEYRNTKLGLCTLLYCLYKSKYIQLTSKTLKSVKQYVNKTFKNIQDENINSKDQ